jgi:hypothetical protein
LAVKLSLGCESVKELASRLEEILPQNSTATRRRNVNIIISRFFPSNELDQFPRRVLLAHGDDSLLEAVMRVLFLEAELVVGKLIAERLWPLPAGTDLPKDFFVQYAQEIFGRKEANASYRCRTSARVLGWIHVEKNSCFVAHQAPDETTALLIFHHHYAPTPGVIDVRRLLTEPTWKYMAFSSEDAVRAFMRKLERRGLISRYSVVDGLEQVTTRYSLESLLDRRARV